MTPGRRLAAAVAAPVLVVGLLLGAGDPAGGGAGAVEPAAASRVLAAPAVTTSLPVPDGVVRPEPSRPDPAQVGEDLAADVDRLGGRVSVGVLDVESGFRVVTDDERHQTASVVKVDVLVALMVRQDGRLRGSQRARAADMIRVSDNDVVSGLIAEAGGERAVARVNRSLGLTDTDVDALLWGSSRTTVADQLRVLEAVFDVDSPLPRSSRRTIARLMTEVVDEQRVGVPAAADDPDDTAVKAGYVVADADGRWVVGSIGRVRVDGRTMLVAVLSHGNTTFEGGVERIERAARRGVAVTREALADGADLVPAAPSA